MRDGITGNTKVSVLDDGEGRVIYLMMVRRCLHYERGSEKSLKFEIWSKGGTMIE